MSKDKRDIDRMLSIVIPCFNEEEGLPELTARLEIVKLALPEWRTEFVFVDDGSTDGTYRVLLEEFGSADSVQIIRHEQNRGIGAAQRTGFSHSEGDVVVTIDSDCTYDPCEIPDLLAVLDPATDIVLGSPYHPAGKIEGVSFLRSLLSRTLSGLYRVFVSSDLHTYTGIFRAYRRDVIRQIDFEADDFLSLAEILVKAVTNDYRIREYPTTLHYRANGRSKLKIPQTILRHLRFLIRIVFSRRTLITVRKGESHA